MNFLNPNMRNSRESDLRKKLDQNDDKDLFMAGACFYLALKIHEMHQLKIRVSCVDGSPAHVWCLFPDSFEGLDAEGINPETEIIKLGWGPASDISAEELINTIKTLDPSEELRNMLFERAEQYISENLQSDLNCIARKRIPG